MARVATDLTTARDGIPDWSAPAVHSFTVDDFHRFSASGVLGPEDPGELIAGQVYGMAPVGAPHAASG